MKFLSLLCCIAPLDSWSQVEPKSQPVETTKKTKSDLSDRLTNEQWNRILNRSFLTVLGSKGDNGGLGSFATFDPVAGAFTFKGTIPIGKKEKKVNYLSLALKGDLISDNYAKLFSDSKLNTNIGIEAQFHVRLRKSEIIIDKADAAGYIINKQAILNKEKTEVAENSRAKANRKDFIRETELEKKLFEDNIAKDKKAYADKLSQAEINALDSKITLDARTKEMEELKKASTALEKLGEGLVKIVAKLDSVNLVVANATGHSDYVHNQIVQRANKALEKLDSAFIPAKAVTLNWLTFTLGGGKKKYHVYDPTRQFSTHLYTNDTAVYNVSVAWNNFKQNLLFNRARYINIGIWFTKDNNASLLSTQQINQEIVIKNAAGDTVRKLVKTYQAFTEPIKYFSDIALPVNYYFLFGKKTSGFHLFPTMHFPKNMEAYFNFGAGYVISFVQNKKEQPLINLEAYIQFTDMFNNLDLDSRFWNRNEIGVRFSLPFNLMSKK